MPRGATQSVPEEPLTPLNVPETNSLRNTTAALTLLRAIASACVLVTKPETWTPGNPATIKMRNSHRQSISNPDYESLPPALRRKVSTYESSV